MGGARRIAGLLLLCLAAPALYRGGSMALRADFPATSGAIACSVFLIALAAGLASKWGPSPRAALIASAALLLLRFAIGAIDAGAVRLAGSVEAGRVIALLLLLALPAAGLGRGLRAFGGSSVGPAALAGSCGVVMAALLVPVIGRTGLDAFADLALVLSAALVPAGEPISGAIAPADLLPLLAGAAGGVSASVFASRLEALSAGLPEAAAIPASLLLALGAGALLGTGIGRVHGRRAIVLLAAGVGAAALFHALLLHVATLDEIRSAIYRFSPRSPFEILLSTAYAFAPLAVTFGLATGALLAVIARSRDAPWPAVAALALGLAVGIVAAGRGPFETPASPSPKARELPVRLTRREPDVMIATAGDREAFRWRREPASLVVALATRDRDSLSLEAFRDASRATTPDGLFCQWARLDDASLATNELPSVLHAFLLAFPRGGVWITGFGEKQPWLLLAGPGRDRRLEVDIAGDALTARGPLARFLSSGERLLPEVASAPPATLERATLAWSAGIANSPERRDLPARLDFFARRRSDLAPLVRLDALPLERRDAVARALRSLQAASEALVRADVAHLREEWDLEARFVPAEEAARRDARWDALAEALAALPGDPEIERLVCAAASEINPAERRLRLERFAAATGGATGGVAKLLDEARATEKR